MRSRPRPFNRQLHVRTLAASLAALMFWAASPAHGDPADVFTLGAPVIGSDPPKASALGAGDASVSSQTGAFEYGYPITVPPGRNGMQPKLSLSYSSQGAIYGGIAAGWSLPVPAITLDTSAGRLWQEGAGAPAARWVSSLAGGHPLVAVNEFPTASLVFGGGGAPTTFRAKNDATFTRYEQLSTRYAWFAGLWDARTTDGMVYSFGQTSHTDGSFTGGTACADVTWDYAPLTRVVDSFGNAVDYYYEAGVTGECRLSAVTWGENDNAGISDFARIKLNYSVPKGCSTLYTGAQSSYRDGSLRVSGASQLDSIVVTAYEPGQSGTAEHTRTITLGYDAQASACAKTHAPYRALASIQETAVGVDSPQVSLPAVTFTYGSADFGSGALAFSAPTQVNTSWYANGQPSAGAQSNLAWGYRFDSDRWPTVEATMVDIDGDGLVDRLVNAPLTSGNYYCHAKWYRNTGGFHFEGGRDIPLPTLKWATPSDAPPFAGGSSPNLVQDPVRGLEGCALNYQRTNYQNSFVNTDYKCHTTSGNSAYCDDPNSPDYGSTSNLPTANVQAKATYLSYRWFDINGDGLVDLVVSPSSTDAYNPAWGDEPGAPQEPPMLGTFAHWKCPSQPYGEPDGLGGPMCGKMFPWIVYLNKGGGRFGKPTSSNTTPVPDQITYQPIPLDADTGDSSLTASPIGSTEGTLDIDGDGYPDGVVAPSSSQSWSVFRNDMNGTMVPNSTAGTAGYSFGAFGMTLSTTEDIQDPTTNYLYPVSAGGLLDLNGDGLPDLWETTSNKSSAFIHWNDGQSFMGQSDGFAFARPGNDASLSCYGGCTYKPHLGGQPFPIELQRVDSRRVLDADADGRPDVVVTPPPGTGSPVVYLNQGGSFSDVVPAQGDPASLSHQIVVTDKMANLNPDGLKYTWEVRSDVLDLDGDGIPEGVAFVDHTYDAAPMMVSKIPTPTSPPRLMASIANGRGATTTVAYAPITDSGTVTTDFGVAMPRTQWVVKSVVSTDSLANTSSTTTYAYKNPHYSVEGDLQKNDWMIFAPVVVGPSKTYAFRGFDEVTVTGPSGAKTVERYGYDVDWSGRLTTRLVIPAEAPSEVRSIEDTTWEPRYLFCDHIFGCALKTYHAVKVDHWTCKNGQNEATCRTNTDTVTESVATLSELSSTSGTWPLWKETSSRVSSTYQGAPPYTAHEGDRITDSTYVLVSDATNYRLLPSTETHSVITNGAAVPFAKVAHSYDANNLVALTDDVWLMSDGSAHAISDRVYDMTTGNIVRTRRPNQHAVPNDAGLYASLTYDTRKLFPVTSLNELGHELDFTYEYGTGTKLETKGPNTATCVAASNCPTGALTKQDHRIRIDGIGRTIETYDTFSDYGSYFSSAKVSMDSYVDGAPSSATHQQAYDINASGVVSYTKSTVTLDGHGRPTRSTFFVFGSAPVDAVTTYQYSNDGKLRSVTVPDPTANNASTVAYTYTYDSLGRPTGMRRPDSAVATSQSGVDMSYDGLVSGTTEHVNAGDGKPATTRTTHDAFGRLIKVEEAIAGTPVSAWVTTTYGYDAADRITQITDPQNVSTAITYDFAGRRTGVVRPAATWTFTYDADGNVASLTMPNSCAAGDPVCAARFMSTYVYDALDRLTTKQVAHRDLSAADLALFSVDTEKYDWDYNGASPGTYVGQMTHWSASGPGNANPQSILYRKDAHGQDAIITLVAKAEGASFSRAYQQSFGIKGAPTYVNYRDAIGGSNVTTSLLSFDGRGLPLSIKPTIAGVTGGMTMGVQTRNVAGLVTKRHTDQSGTMTFIESNWTYDKLGRVTSQLVQHGPGPVRVAEQDIAYFGNDDPKTLEQYLGAAHKQLAYSYDFRHQLTAAQETTTSGAYFSGTYTYGTAGRFNTAIETSTAPGPGSEVTPRNVTYVYGGTDPEEVTALKSGTSMFASYAYDPSGNQTLRCMGGSTTACAGDSVEYLYDGSDRLRRATTKHNGVVQGSEEYWYGDKEQRIATVRKDGAGTKTETIVWLRDTEAHYDGTNAVTNIYSYVTLGTAVARINRTGNTAATIEYDFHGLANNTLAAVDSSGSVNASFSYAPFGELIETTNGGGIAAGVAAHPRRMNDKYVDAGTGLAYYGARYYDKTLVGWTQMDPLYRFAPAARWVKPRRGNLYSFVLNNANRYLDPDGLDPWTRGAFHWSAGGVVGQGGIRAAWAKETRGFAYGGPDAISFVLDAALAAAAAREMVPVECVGPPGMCTQAVDRGSPSSQPSLREYSWQFKGSISGTINDIADSLALGFEPDGHGGIKAVHAGTAGKIVATTVAAAGIGLLAWGALAPAAVSGGAAAGAGAVAAAQGDPEAVAETTTLFRAVSAGEFEQVLSTGTFQAGANSLGGKFFAESAADASRWGDALNGPGNYKILEVTLPTSSVNQMMYWPRLDAIGPAWYAELPQLDGAVIKAAGQ